MMTGGLILRCAECGRKVVMNEKDYREGISIKCRECEKQIMQVIDQCEIRGHEALKKNRLNCCLRSCSINTGKQQEQAFFHCWEHYAEIVCPSSLIGGHKGGQLSGTFAIVELKNGEVRKVLPQYITFTDCEVD